MTLYLCIDGLDVGQLPLRVSDGDVTLDVAPSSPLYALAFVDSMVRQGRLPGVVSALAAQQSVETDTAAVRIVPEPDLAEMGDAAAEWRTLSGRELASDVVSIDSRFLRTGLVLPRPTLMRTLDALQRLRRVGAADVGALKNAVDRGDACLEPGVSLREQTAASQKPWRWTDTLGDHERAHLASLDANAARLYELMQSGTPEAIAEARAPLLAELQRIGLLSTASAEHKDDVLDDAGYDNLWRLYAAVQEVAAYHASDARAAAGLGPAPSDPSCGPVSLDWFLVGTYPPPGFAPAEFIASIEAAFAVQRVTLAHGERTVEVPAGHYIAAWRTERGTPALVSARRQPSVSRRAVFDGPSREQLGVPEASSRGDDAALKALERRARSLDDGDEATLTARRRYLLQDLQAACVLADNCDIAEALERLGCTQLLSYHRAAAHLLAYYHSDARRAWLPGATIPLVVGGPVSLEWFRTSSQATPPESPALDWLARLEHTLIGSERIGDHGQFLFHVYDHWFVISWYREDGLTPSLLRAQETQRIRQTNSPPKP